MFAVVLLHICPTYLDVFDTDNVGLCNGAYGCVAVGVDAFDAPGL